MATQTIPAHVDGATVEVFEPRQHPDQAEVILDRFEMLPNEPKTDYEIRSATAGIRYLPLGEETRRRLATEAGGDDGFGPVKVVAEPTPGQEPRDVPVNTDEVEAGRARQQELQSAADANEGQPAQSTTAEVQTGEEAPTPPPPNRKQREPAPEPQPSRRRGRASR